MFILTDPSSKESEHLSTLLFNMYAKVRDISILKVHTTSEDDPDTNTSGMY